MREYLYPNIYPISYIQQIDKDITGKPRKYKAAIPMKPLQTPNSLILETIDKFQKNLLQKRTAEYVEDSNNQIKEVRESIQDSDKKVSQVKKKLSAVCR